MRARIVWAIARKDMADILGNKFVWMPLATMPLIMCGVMPAAMLLGGPEGGKDGQAAVGAFLRLVPPDVAALAAGRSADEALTLIMLAHGFAPLFLMVPLTLASVVGANGFAGEKERKTLEPLLYAPISDAELFAGKALAALIPAVGAAWAGFALYTAVLNGLGWSIMERWWFPLRAWWPLVFWVTPAVAGLGVGIAVIVSSRVNTFVEANQTASLLGILAFVVLAGVATIALTLTAPVAFALGAVIWLLDALVLALAVRRFARSAQIGKL